MIRGKTFRRDFKTFIGCSRLTSIITSETTDEFKKTTVALTYKRKEKKITLVENNFSCRHMEIRKI